MTPEFERVNSLAEITAKQPTFLAIGVFDGVHRGHQYLLQSMVSAARAANARPAVLTFFPHPKVVIQGLDGRLYLTTLERRVALLAEQGVELVIVHPFNQEVRQIRAAAFVDRLCRHLDLRQLWGGSFSLGYNREGNAAYLSQLGEERGFTVHQVDDLMEWQGKPVSSSRIREALAAGDLQEVNGCLGRNFYIEGHVAKGDQRGRTIGFPTANVTVWEQQLLPAHGVYATYAHVGEERYVAATNVGVRPTVDTPRLTVEAHLLDFDRDIYDRALALEFVSRIRDERKFPGIDALKAQIEEDVEQVREQLSPAL